ncbi:hypothetical protein TNIN_379531 [Trichonephila inaurata madagascariensis]|uniref:Uncharacterized protein n=1 Tax=Trichonephila inaurata madagascariensis TaxID=2747483 RepID=A0A8X7CI68_9ARAC|nr:hypothetical protein TNIN_379531 [Trichonephila inaurata madagascariensis]
MQFLKLSVYADSEYNFCSKEGAANFPNSQNELDHPLKDCNQGILTWCSRAFTSITGQDFGFQLENVTLNDFWFLCLIHRSCTELLIYFWGKSLFLTSGTTLWFDVLPRAIS